MHLTRSSQNYSNYQRGAYSAIPEQERKTAVSLDTAIQDWDSKDEIKYHPSERGETPYYYSDSQQPESLLGNSQRFIARLIKPEERALHRQGIEAVVNDLKNRNASLEKGNHVEKDFFVRKMLGQPLSIGALKQSLDQIETSTTSKNSNSSSFSLPKSRRKFRLRKSTLSTAARNFSLRNLFPGKKDYQPIPEDNHTKPRGLKTTAYYQGDNSEMHR